MFHKITETYFKFPLSTVRTAFQNFYDKHPLFRYAVYWILGAISHSQFSSGIVILLLLLILEKKMPKNLPLALFVISFLLAGTIHPSKNSVIEGNGVFRVLSTKKIKDYYVCTGKFLNFRKKNSRKKYKNIPCSVLSNKKQQSGTDYILSGKLKYITNSNKYSFKKNADFIKSEPRQLMSNPRTFIRNKIIQYIGTNYPSPEVQSLLTGIFLGKSPPKDLKEKFQKLGLAHLLVVSGFHFSFFTKLLLPITFLFRKNHRAIFLIVMSSLFLLVQETTPSVMRSWICGVVLFSDSFFKGRCSGINRLSLALILISAFDPSSLFSLNFQLSFLATAGIMFLYNPIAKFLKNCLLGYSSLSRNVINRLLQKIGLSICDIMAVDLAVHIFLWPILLKYFLCIPLNGVFYNLFVPLLTYPVFILTSTGAVLNLKVIHTLNHYWCTNLLSLINDPPITFKEIRSEQQLSQEIVFIYVIAVIIIGIILNEKTRHFPEEEKFL
ncbi:MAG: ComEC/Rec2 family competence protein [Victivallaceae bacterium]